MDKKKLLRLGALAPLLLALSGCFQMDSTLRFAEGTVKPEVIMHISHQLVSIDQEVTVEEFHAFSGEKRQEYCETFMSGEDGPSPQDSGPVPAVEPVVTEEGFDDAGWLVCRATSDPVPVSELQDESFAVTYTDGTYQINSAMNEIMGETTESQVEISPSQLKEMGVEASMTLAFTGAITNAALDGVEFGTEDEPAGIILTENSITLDVFEVSGDLDLTATDEVETVSSLADYAPLLLVVVVVIAGMFLVTLRNRRKTSTSATASEAPASDDDASDETESENDDEESQDSDDDEDSTESAADDEEDLMALAAQYGDPVIPPAVPVDGDEAEAVTDESEVDSTEEGVTEEETDTLPETESTEGELLEDEDPELAALVAEYARGDESLEASEGDDTPVAEDATEEEAPASMFFPVPEDDETSDESESEVAEDNGYTEQGLPDPEAAPVNTLYEPRFEGNPFRKQ